MAPQAQEAPALVHDRVEFYESDIEGKSAILIIETLEDGSTRSVKLLYSEMNRLIRRLKPWDSI